jgi:hypothetical protein
VANGKGKRDDVKSGIHERGREGEKLLPWWVIITTITRWVVISTRGRIVVSDIV